MNPGWAMKIEKRLAELEDKVDKLAASHGELTGLVGRLTPDGFVELRKAIHRDLDELRDFVKRATGRRGKVS